MRDALKAFVGGQMMEKPCLSRAFPRCVKRLNVPSGGIMGDGHNVPRSDYFSSSSPWLGPVAFRPSRRKHSSVAIRPFCVRLM